MARLAFLVRVTLPAILLDLVYGGVNQVPLPPIDLEEWWGPGNTSCGQDTSIWDFTIEFDESMIYDLRHRLKSHRLFTPPLEGVGFEYGFNSEAMPYWVKYLSEDYQFEERQAYLNQYPQYKTNIQGLNIHFLRIQSKNLRKHEVVVPLLILHGYPGSVREFYETIPHLLSMSKKKGFALDIIIPSLPGYGFSDGAVRPGLGVDKAAIVFRNLMHRIGYSEYYIQGGDMGSLIANVMTTYFPNEVKGYHINFALLHTPEILFRLFLGSYHPEEIAKPEVQNRIYPLSKTFFGLVERAGYLHIQATKPDTIAMGLSDSPVGFLAYTLEEMATIIRKKFISYPDGGLTKIFTEDQLLDNFMMYWASNSITTAMRLYAETFNKRHIRLRINEIRTPVPTWVIQASDELVYLPGWMIKMKFPNLLHETIAKEGGHFYAWEKPKEFAEDVTNAIVAFRKWHAMNSTMYTKCTNYILN